MTEEEWVASEDWYPMAEFLSARAAARNDNFAETRKANLLCAACCRMHWGWLTDGCRSLVLAIERHADRPALTDPDWGEFAEELQSSRDAAPEDLQAAFDALEDAAYTTWQIGTQFGGAAERKEQTPLARDIFGNPFRAVVVDPAWLAWSEGRVRRLAQSIYDDRAFDRLPVLADALEDAGCADRAVLDHCRSGGPHVRGCWVLDLLLGKN
jgi:hypothetical protein